MSQENSGGCPRRKVDGLPSGAVVRLADMANYNEGAIVSRTLAESRTTTITVFAFDEGQGLSEHSTPYDALVQVLDGAGTFTVGGKKLGLSAGDAMIMPANVPHALKAAQRFKMLLTMFLGSSGCAGCGSA